MRFPAFAVRSARLFLPLLAAALILTVPVGQAAAQETTTSSTTAGNPALGGSTGTSTWPYATTTTQTGSGGAPSAQPGSAAQPAATAIVAPAAGLNPLNPGWKTSQIEVRIMPEYDAKAVLAILGFSLPADVPLPATLKLPIPAGAQIAGIGEIDPNGNFTYNYENSYPPVEKGTEWDIATIEVKSYRDLQVDYYYDPGLPPAAGQRSFPILVQAPLDTDMLLLHVQQPSGATEFQVQPALDGTGKAGDGFTYSVSSYPTVAAGSTLGHAVSYYKADGSLSIDSGQPSSGGSTSSSSVSTTTVLLAAILAVVIIVGALVIYRLFFKSAKPQPKKGGPKGRQSQVMAAPTAKQGAKQQGQSGKNQKNGTSKATNQRGATVATAGAAAAASTTDDPAASPQTEMGADEAAETGPAAAGQATEYCVACGEELNPDSPFCPSCGEARS